MKPGNNIRNPQIRKTKHSIRFKSEVTSRTFEIRRKPLSFDDDIEIKTDDQTIPLKEKFRPAKITSRNVTLKSQRKMDQKRLNILFNLFGSDGRFKGKEDDLIKLDIETGDKKVDHKKCQHLVTELEIEDENIGVKYSDFDLGVEDSDEEILL